jgi:hypothetical protein
LNTSLTFITYQKSLQLLSKLFTSRLDRASCIVTLELLTFAYLGLPAVLWLFGWLHFYLALPLALALVASITYAWRQTRCHCTSPDFVATEKNTPLWSFVGALLLALLWGLYSGAGGFTATSPDWTKHYAILRDLTEGSWPVTYSINGQPNSLVFYLGYYLPAAGVAKIFGWWSGCLTLSVWTCLGTMLAVAWLVLLAGRYPLLAALLFIFANGLDFFGERIVRGGVMAPGTEHIDWWSGLINLPGHYSQLIWAPQHSLAAWIVTGLLAVQLSSRRGIGHALLLASLATFWSPFTIIGFIPLAVVAWVKSGRKGIFTLTNLLALILLTVVSLFYLSRSYSSPHGFLWEVTDLRLHWPKLALVYLLEWVLFFIFARELRSSSDPWLRIFFWTAAASLALLPLYTYGFSNDWGMRTTIPAMYLLWVGVIRSLLNRRPKLETRLLLVLVLFGAFGALHESSRTWYLPTTKLVDREAYLHVPELDNPYRDQYLGKTENFFFKYMAKKSVPLDLIKSSSP